MATPNQLIKYDETSVAEKKIIKLQQECDRFVKMVPLFAKKSWCKIIDLKYSTTCFPDSYHFTIISSRDIWSK